MTPAPFSASLNNALANIRAAAANLSPDDRTRIEYAVNDLEPVLKDELDAVLKAATASAPFGGVIDAVGKDFINRLLDHGLAQLNAAKTAVA